MGRDKLWLDVAGRPLVAWTMSAVAAAGLFDRIVVVAPAGVWERWRAVARECGVGDAVLSLVEGGERRQDSVRAGLEACGDAEVVCVHDAARAACPPALFHVVVDEARQGGAATAVVPLVDSVKRVDDQGTVRETLDRARLVAVQTPQAFSLELLRRAHREALEAGTVADDDCALVERLGVPVRTVAGDVRNVKVTTPFDLAVLHAALTTPRRGMPAVHGGSPT